LLQPGTAKTALVETLARLIFQFFPSCCKSGLAVYRALPEAELSILSQLLLENALRALSEAALREEHLSILSQLLQVGDPAGLWEQYR
jgi:hypothetical protein